jgi:hypothetical protein
MKTSISHQPRFLCRLVRFWSPLTGGASSRHAAACADCQRYFAACDNLDSSLRRDAGGQRENTPHGLEQRILRAVNLSTPPPPTSLLRPGLLALLGVAAAVVLAAVQFTKPPYPSRIYVPAVDILGPAPVAVAENATPGVDWDAAFPDARALLQQDPLNDEVKSVYHDAKSAVNFLAQNFLPTAAESAVTSEQQPAA